MTATFLCGLNALKPPVADDPAYLYYARQIASQPGDPYGFKINWYGTWQPAMNVLAPPVFPYWLGLGVALFGDDPTVLKLWSWPWCLAFTTGVYGLLRRFAQGVERPMLWFIAMSPAVLPAVNLMLDVPALALGLLTVGAMLSASERESFDLAATAGLLAGLAMQTKYSAFTVPAVLAFAAGRNHWRLTVVAWLAATAVFAGWECFLVQRYGESHFLYHLTHGQQTAHRANMIGPMFTLVGGVGGALVPLGFAALRASGRIVGASSVVVVASYVALAIVPSGSAQACVSWETLAFGVTGFAVLSLVTLTVFVARRPAPFLAVWLAVEVAGYFALSPWPAARRVLPITVIAALLFAWLAVWARRDGRLVTAAAAISVILGLLYQAADIDGAWALRRAIQTTDEYFRRREPPLVAAFVGRHGMQFESERMGWQKIPLTRVKGPHWLGIAVDSQDAAILGLTPADIPLSTVEIHGYLPWTTQPAYSGMKVPLQSRSSVRPSIMVISACR